MRRLWLTTAVFQLSKFSTLTRLFGLSCQTKPEDSFSPRLVTQRPLTQPSRSFLSTLKYCSTCVRYRAARRPDLRKGRAFPMQQKEKVNISQKAKANMAKANQRRLVLGFKFQTIVRFLSTENNCASAGRLDDALQRSSQGRDAWLVIICAGRRDATRTTRATNAQSDTCERRSS